MSTGNLNYHAGDSAKPSRPSLFTALEEQLGLKLEMQERPVDVLVIDILKGRRQIQLLPE
jgi:uncharacterized protein (TIGR03435 family)